MDSALGVLLGLGQEIVRMTSHETNMRPGSGTVAKVVLQPLASCAG